MRRRRSNAEAAEQLAPFLKNILRSGGSGGAGNSAGTDVGAHDLGGSLHTGTLRTDQAPWAVSQSQFSSHQNTINAHLGLAANSGLTTSSTLLTLGTPGTSSATTTNNVSGTTHAHAIASTSNGNINRNWLLESSSNGGLEMAFFRAPLFNTSSGNMELQPAGDLVTNPLGKDIRPSANYDINIGMITHKYLTLHAAELWVETLVAQDTIATIGGRILVGPTTTLIADLGTGGTTIDVKHNQMSSGDRVYMEADGKIEFMAIISSATTITGGYRYSVTRNLDGTGANQWYAGDAVFNTGQTGNGFIDLYSLSGVPHAGQTSSQRAGPSIVGNVRLSSTFNDFEERWAIGNLDGLYDYGTDVYGFAAGDPDGAWIGVDATNGVRIMNSGSTEVIRLDTSGNSYFAGVMTIGTSGEIRQGTGTLGSNYTGLRIWRSSNVGLIGGYNNNTLQWYANTDGKLYAAGGDIWQDVNGINILVVPVDTDPAVFRFITSGGTEKGAISCAFSAAPLPDPNDGMYYSGTRHHFLGAIKAHSGVYTNELTAYTDGGNIAINSPIGTAFTGLSYNTGWGDYGGSNQDGRYKKIGDIVALEGLVARTSGSLAVIATLPSGYRPSANLFFSVATNSGPGVVYVDSAGNIGHTSGGTTWVSLGGISFSTE